MLRFILPSIIWTILLIIVSLAPSSSMEFPEIQFEGADKVAHLILYSLTSLFWTVGLKRQNVYPQLRSRAYVVAILGGFSLSFMLEILQEVYTYSRHFEVLDLIANGIGCIFGVIIFKVIYQGYSKA